VSGRIGLWVEETHVRKGVEDFPLVAPVVFLVGRFPVLDGDEMHQHSILKTSKCHVTPCQCDNVTNLVTELGTKADDLFRHFFRGDGKINRNVVFFTSLVFLHLTPPIFQTFSAAWAKSVLNSGICIAASALRHDVDLHCLANLLIEASIFEAANDAVGNIKPWRNREPDRLINVSEGVLNIAAESGGRQRACASRVMHSGKWMC
jgi:hypothetical protein